MLYLIGTALHCYHSIRECGMMYCIKGNCYYSTNGYVIWARFSMRLIESGMTTSQPAKCEEDLH